MIVMFQQIHCTESEGDVISVSCCAQTDWLSPSISRDLTSHPNTVSVRTARTSFISVQSPGIGRNVKPDFTLINSSVPALLDSF